MLTSKTIGNKTWEVFAFEDSNERKLIKNSRDEVNNVGSTLNDPTETSENSHTVRFGCV